ncbi:cellulose biosynthesis protein BcsG [Trinickia dabaoshanensis]|uniref:Cellulose biosynthesis protein BcsG n=1 Tax=Trinickia dabaoshanensis TaxID=564714 RepID=A0A2N7VCZ0_9BURK|nr:cellulose biosynthesis protein BcsG [Trinickia dabaoshanensis]PMS14964.1 cellulose biosynthesis protein BcsG [Trinickia dabaoshanensis]
MTFWNLYFILKLSLFATGHLKPLWLANLAFVAVLALTSPIRQRAWRIVRFIAGLGIGVPLLYHEAIVPPFSRVMEEASGLESFTAGYWVELASRFLPPAIIVAVVAVVLGHWLVNRWLRVASFVVVALVALPIWHFASLAISSAQSASANGARTTSVVEQPLDHNAALAAFRTAESQRQVTFGKLSANPNEQFDVIILHICSLSWDDLDVAKARDNPMLSHFDYLLTNFSTAASYSGPAAIRVLRASCGQEAHADLYKPAPQQCYLLSDLARAGFTPQILMNHDGHFDNFLDLAKENAAVPGVTVQSNADAAVTMHAFDGSVVHDDYSTWANWYAKRAQTPGPVALYYNTISLHDGNRVIGKEKLSSLESYPYRVNTLMNEVDQLADLIAKSGRRAVIVFVPEHGAALRGDANQIAGLREIPTPRIIHGPVGVRIVGLPGAHGPTTVIDTPTSFLALAQLLSNLVSNSPFKPGVALSQYAAGLPQTQMVGENEGTVTLKTANGYAVKTPDGVWVDQN